MILWLVLRKKNFTQMAKYGKTQRAHIQKCLQERHRLVSGYNTKLIRELFDTENDLACCGNRPELYP